MRSLLAIALLAIISCSKTPDTGFNDFECLYGTHRIFNTRTYLGCLHRDMVMVGGDQEAADRIAEQYSLPRVDVSNRKDYKDFEAIPTTDCKCP